MSTVTSYLVKGYLEFKYCSTTDHERDNNLSLFLHSEIAHVCTVYARVVLSVLSRGQTLEVIG